MKIKNTTVNIVQGDITLLKVDAIINAAHPTLKMEEGLAGMIKSRGGSVIEEEAVEKGPLLPGHAIWTNAGELPANFLIHTVTVSEERQTNQDVLRSAVANALKCTDEIKAYSIAIPALGCGVGGFSALGAAKIIVQEILKFCRHTDTGVGEITLCLYDDETFRVFDKEARGYIHHVLENLGDEPYYTADIIIELPEGIILIERSNPPYGWALPGGFLDPGENQREAAIRETKEETNMDLEDLREFGVYGEKGRDPRFHTITTVFVGKGVGTPQFGDDAKGLKIVPYEELMNHEYAFDHKDVIRHYLEGRKS
ncbi:MAG: NUDIX domain-containing protein [Candidatus Omnitrophica bacterium]|nr:NUDIX domain-containing protein [Candidatus Omnitrophota bacterium]